jgi:serine/threonine protein kinase
MGTKSPMFERSGTPGYIAPEILNLAKGEVLLDHRCDIFSLGVIAHLLYNCDNMLDF